MKTGESYSSGNLRKKFFKQRRGRSGDSGPESRHSGKASPTSTQKKIVRKPYRKSREREASEGELYS